MYKEETVPCDMCGTPTTFTGTKRCNPCWETERWCRHRPDIASRVLASEGIGSLSFLELICVQTDLQESMGQPTGAGEDVAKESLLHASVEVVEAMSELNFKPWKAKKKLVDLDAFATELTDVMQFLANAAIAMNITAAQLSEALRAKWQVNRQRTQLGETTKAATNE